jgi:hypothetical protein
MSLEDSGFVGASLSVSGTAMAAMRSTRPTPLAQPLSPHCPSTVRPQSNGAAPPGAAQYSFFGDLGGGDDGLAGALEVSPAAALIAGGDDRARSARRTLSLPWFARPRRTAWRPLLRRRRLSRS